MKTMKMNKDFSHRAAARVFVQYLADRTYDRVPEAAVRAIIASSAGEIVNPAAQDE